MDTKHMRLQIEWTAFEYVHHFLQTAADQTGLKFSSERHFAEAMKEQWDCVTRFQFMNSNICFVFYNEEVV